MKIIYGYQGEPFMIQNVLTKDSTLSFEVFPPKKDGEFEAAFEVLKSLSFPPTISV